MQCFEFTTVPQSCGIEGSIGSMPTMAMTQGPVLSMLSFLKFLGARVCIYLVTIYIYIPWPLKPLKMTIQAPVGNDNLHLPARI